MICKIKVKEEAIRFMDLYDANLIKDNGLNTGYRDVSIRLRDIENPYNLLIKILNTDISIFFNINEIEFENKRDEENILRQFEIKEIIE